MTQPLAPDFDPMPYSVPYRVAGLSSRKPTRFDLEPDAEMRKAIAAFLGINTLEKLRFTGMISPRGRFDFMLEATLDAVVEQACVVSLAPVNAVVKEDVLRVFLAKFEVPEASEAEMTEDDTIEALGEVIDAGHVLVEALSLALPPFPKAEGAVLEVAEFAAPGLSPIRDEDLKPFAGLAALKSKLENVKKDTDEGDA